LLCLAKRVTNRSGIEQRWSPNHTERDRHDFHRRSLTRD
jgi:hypothetical protein